VRVLASVSRHMPTSVTPERSSRTPETPFVTESSVGHPALSHFVKDG